MNYMELNFFPKVELKVRYHQIRVDKEDIQKTFFHTHHGLYEFLLMPFRLTNATTFFQCAMNNVLHMCLWKCVLVFFDDILIYNKM